MNLLGLLLKGMIAKESVQAVSQHSGANKTKSTKLIKLAIPLLLKYLTGNAASQSGALSLLGALSQHNSQASMAEQISNADMQDGQAILGHILGNNSSSVYNQLANESGMSEQQVQTALSSMAPALLSSLSAATTVQNQVNTNQQNVDLSALASLLGNAQAKPAKPAKPQKQEADLSQLISLLGGAQAKPAKPAKPQKQEADLSQLISLLGGAQAKPAKPAKPQKQEADLSQLVSLLGGAQAQQSQPEEADGSQLLSILSALMK